MPQPMLPAHTGNLAITIIPESNGGYLCELTPSLGDGTALKQSSHGQSRSHAIAVALEKLAQAFRLQAESEQSLDWQAVNRSESGQVVDKRFHVIVHYEWVGPEESKFEAMVNTTSGNTVMENAEISIIQVGPDLPVEPLKRRRLVEVNDV